MNTVCWLPPHAGYTHLLKVDDDTYVRIDRVLRALRDPLDEAGQPVLQREMQQAPGMGGTMAAARAAGLAASSGTNVSSGGTALPVAGGDGRLPATRQQLLDQASKTGTPMHTDGILLYNMTELVEAAGRKAGGL